MSSLRSAAPLLALAASLAGLAVSAAPLVPPAAGFDQAYAPLVARKCLSCHAGTEPAGKLDLTRAATVLGTVVRPGKVEASRLLDRVRSGSMPPDPKQRLTAAETGALTAWVKAGANWPAGRVLSAFDATTSQRAGYDWWSLQPVRRPQPPRAGAGWARNPVDAFVAARLRSKGLAPAPEADRLTLLRRLKFDLLGLPPTPEEVDGFLSDRSPDAYEKVVDRFLASPHYGERWARHWLDVARFTESDGFEQDVLRDGAWQYRDYVVNSLNADKPYDRFVMEQLAGDVLEPVTRDGRVATGFLVAGPWDQIQRVGKSATERLRAMEEQREELLAAVGQTFLGLTVNCARCHDHKFDPIPQEDYYRLRAVFDGVDHASGTAHEEQPVLTPAESAELETRIAPLRRRVAEGEARLAALRGDGGAVPGFLAAASLGEGRFGEALDARRGVFTAETRPEYRDPPLTVECWARLYSKAGFNILVANNPKESSAHWELYSYAGAGDFSLYLPGCSPAEIRSGTDITDGRWHHVAAQIEAARVRLFVDGRLARETGITRTAPPGPLGVLTVGAYPPQKIACDGLVDAVRISRGIRPFEALPESPPVRDAGTLALWQFDRSDVTPPAPAVADREREAATLQVELGRAREELAKLQPPLAYIGIRRQPEPSVLYLRGDIRKPGPVVQPAAPRLLRTLPGDLHLPAEAPEGQRRLALARWVADPGNPLLSRVMVNRIWQYHFGQGLVDTPSDFGFNGGRPSHPELLDWLASVFASPANRAGGSKSAQGSAALALTGSSGMGFSLKALHRLMVTSATYRQGPRFDARAAAVDADNRLLWRFAPRRLDGEVVRDAMLAVSGKLNPEVGGPSFRPFTVTVFNTSFYHLIDRDEPQFNRRTLYRIHVNTGRDPLLDLLDCPSPSIATPRRRTTTTPLAALALMNDSFVLRQADALAERARAAGALEAQVARAYLLALNRTPGGEERGRMVKLAREHGVPAVCWALLNSSEFLYVR